MASTGEGVFNIVRLIVHGQGRKEGLPPEEALREEACERRFTEKSQGGAAPKALRHSEFMGEFKQFARFSGQ